MIEKRFTTRMFTWLAQNRDIRGGGMKRTLTGAIARGVLVSVIFIFCLSSAEAATLTVTSTVDTIAADGHCTLREAITAVNRVADYSDCTAAGDYGSGDTIGFDILGATDTGCTGAGGVCTIVIAGAGLPNITRTVYINGYTQAGASPNTTAPVAYPDPPQGLDAQIRVEIDGSGASSGAAGLGVVANNSRISGLSIVNFQVSGTGIYLTGSNISLDGNFIGIHADGDTVGSNENGIVISGSGASNNTIGGTEAALRNLIAGNSSNDVAIYNANSTIVTGNLIGTDWTGISARSTAAAALTGGVSVLGSSATSDDSEISNNVIGGRSGFAVLLRSAVSTNVTGNSIGVGVSGQPLSNYGGIYIATYIAGPSHSNVISGNAICNSLNDAGIRIEGSASGDPYANRLDANDMWDNHNLSINLRPVGELFGKVTLNDDPAVLDADTGPNGLQNFPVITSLTNNGSGGLDIAFTLDSAANGSYAISAYASDVCDASGYGPGQYFGGDSQNYNTDAGGHATATLTVPTPLPAGWAAGKYVTLLAHDNVANNTSEFSACMQIPGGALDTTPDQFTFADVTGAIASRGYISAPIIVNGINTPALINLSCHSVSPCSYRINGGNFIAYGSTVNNGDTVEVHITSSATPLEPVWGTINIGGVFDSFDVSTAAFPTVTTSVVSDIKATKATGGGNVTSDSGVPVTARGVCWSTATNPTTADPCTSDGSGTGLFTSSIFVLTPSTTYHIRAYATNAAGTSYGDDELQFTTAAPGTVPTVTTAPIVNIASTSAGSGGNVLSDGGTAIYSRGVCYATAPDPTTEDLCTDDGSGTGAFTSSLTGLTEGETYHARAYAANPDGTGYGNDLSFFTPCGTALARVDATQYGSLQMAANAASGGGVVNANTSTFGSAVFANSGPVELKGGYDCGFSSIVSVSTVSGSITLSGSGSVAISNVVIR